MSDLVVCKSPSQWDRLSRVRRSRPSMPEHARAPNAECLSVQRCWITVPFKELPWRVWGAEV